MNGAAKFPDVLTASLRTSVVPSYPTQSEERAASQRVEGRHSTPERVLHGDFGLPCANLLQAEQLKEESRHRVAVRQPLVSAGELVDSD